MMTQVLESGTFTGIGRRSDLNFASPARRASRDGSEGIRGDHRPPVGTPTPRLYATVQREEMYAPLRTTSHRVSSISSDPAKKKIDLAEENEGAVMAKEKLFSPEMDSSLKNQDSFHDSKGMEKAPGTHGEVFEELGDLLDEALEEQQTLKRTETRSQSLPQESVDSSNANAALSAPKQNLCRGIHGRNNGPLVSENDSITSQYGSDAGRYQGENAISNLQGRACSNRRTPDSEALDHRNPLELEKFQPQSLEHGTSPVKKRAEMFERLGGSTTTFRDEQNQSTAPTHFRLNIPQPASRTFLPPLGNDQQATVMQSKIASKKDTPKPILTHGNEPITLPLRLDLSSRPEDASSQKTDAALNNMSLSTQRNLTIGKVQEAIQNLSATTGHDSSTGFVRVSERKDPIRDTKELTGRNIPPLQAPVSEQVQLMADGGKDDERITEQSTPGPLDIVGRRSQKDSSVSQATTIASRGSQILSDQPMLQGLDPMSFQKQTGRRGIGPAQSSGRPGRENPWQEDATVRSAPFRGRTDRRDIEQRFTLSRSRSRSGGVKVSIEVRPSPERPEEEAIVTVRAAEVEDIRNESEL